MAEWIYTGDINLECGGTFFRKTESDPFPECDYVEAVRVTPVADIGGADNRFIIESGSVYMPRDRYASVLDCLGYRLDGRELVDYAGERESLDTERGQRMLVDAFLAYSGMDRDTLNGETLLQIGAHPDPYTHRDWDPEPDMVAHGNSRLANVIRREWLDS
jgi:hypothetical protein